MSEKTKYNRRRFLGIAAAGAAGASVGLISSASAQAKKTNAARPTSTKPGTHTSFGPLKQIDAGRMLDMRKQVRRMVVR